MDAPVVVAVSRVARHEFSKARQDAIRLVEGFGIEGDVHAGATVKHVAVARKRPAEPNLRQVHLMHAELHDELNAKGFHVTPGDIGENVTTRGVDLLGLPLGTRLRLGGEAVVELTGVRTPCSQLDRFQKGLLKAVVDRDADGNVVLKPGVMAVVVAGGEVRAGDAIGIELPDGEQRPLPAI